MRPIIATTALLLAWPILPALAGGCPHDWRGQYQDRAQMERCYTSGAYGRHEAVARHQRAQQQRGIDQSRAAGNVGPQN